MNSLETKNFNLKATVESGQIFRWSRRSAGDESGYNIIAGNAIMRVRHDGTGIDYDCSNTEFDVETFLGLNHNYRSIIANISKDKIIAAAIKKHHGLRLIEQELWECTASFICSSFSNIPRIRQCIEKVAATFGDKIEFGGVKSYAFPQPQQISSWAKLKKCGLGYRAKYLFETAKLFASNSEEYSQQQLKQLSYKKAKAKLLELPGVGSKVADCILLFSCGFHEAFPVDVWIQRIMEANYGSEIASFAANSRSKAKKLNEKIIAGFARHYFGKHAGYAQQFLFHNARTSEKPSPDKLDIGKVSELVVPSHEL